MKAISLGLVVSVFTWGQTAVMAQFPGEQSPVIIPVPTVDDGGITPVSPPSPSPSVAPILIPSTTGSSNDLYFLTRAKNLARQAAIQQNGGLSQYRPEFSMYGPALQSPFARNDDGSVTFTVKGGVPGASQLDKETEILVTGGAGVTVVYNGPLRTGIGGGGIGGGEIGTGDLAADPNAFAIAALDEDSFIARARNLARQAGISANGGLRVYRPEASMFGPTSNAPFVKNSDDSLTFTFKGGAPLAAQPTQETAVTVTKAGTVTVDFNRSL